MSDTDGFIEEVTEEVRRDRLFAMFKKYGWVAALVIVGVVAGAAWSEYSKAQAEAEAKALGDAMLSALGQDDPATRAAALTATQTESDGGQAVLGFLAGAELAAAGKTEDAVAALTKVATNSDLAPIYRQIASYKALTLQTGTLPAADRRLQFTALATAGSPLRLLAEEQLGLIDIEEGLTDAAQARFQSILSDAEATTGLQQRALQAIVALGGQPEFDPAAGENSGG